LRDAFLGRAHADVSVLAARMDPVAVTEGALSSVWRIELAVDADMRLRDEALSADDGCFLALLIIARQPIFRWRSFWRTRRFARFLIVRRFGRRCVEPKRRQKPLATIVVGLEW